MHYSGSVEKKFPTLLLNYAFSNYENGRLWNMTSITTGRWLSSILTILFSVSAISAGADSGR